MWSANLEASKKVEVSKQEIETMLDPDNWPVVNHWLERGDGIAVYENHEIGHPEMGHRQYVSFGSPAAQLETDEPPQRMPDIGGSINWRYWLIGTYKGAPLGGGPIAIH